MIALDMQQGTPEWLAARLGIPTASCFDRIMTPKTRKASGQQQKYMHQLLAERYLGQPLDQYESEWMVRGTMLEPEAVSAYEMFRNVDTQRVGFVLDDSRRWGCSPDRLVGLDGLAEIKCPSAPVMVAALLGEHHEDYVSQCQGQLWVTGRQWVDLFFYCPGFPPAITRYTRDEGFILSLSQHVVTFCDALDAAWARLNPDGPTGSPAIALPTTPGTDAGTEVSVIRPLSDIERARIQSDLRAAGVTVPPRSNDDDLRALHANLFTEGTH